MSLSSEFITQHIETWQNALQTAFHPHRERWPSRLFHHAPIENAVSILQSGRILSRDDSTAQRVRDVAGQSVINTSARAHKFARLYFRPRTPTQYHIEGIRRPGECAFGDAAHAPVLVMFVFDASRVLQLPGVHFSTENMQTGVVEGSTEEYFKAIPFDKVYHEGSYQDQSIKRHRCAEVLAPSGLVLSENLQWIYCRSEAEKATLQYQLGPVAAAYWDRAIRVSDDLKVFEKRYAFVETVSLVSTGIRFRMNPRPDRAPLAVRVAAWDMNGTALVNAYYSELAAHPENAKLWIVGRQFAPGRYRVAIEIDGHQAYESILTLDDLPF